MHFLIDANLPRSLADRIRLVGHSVTDVRNIGLGDADDEVIAALARGEGMVLPARDFDFADVRNYPPAQYAGIAVVNFPSDTSAGVIVAMIEAALSDPGLLDKLPGRLAIIEPGRVRLRAE